ncbi:MAG: 50S ribosomal protein L32 [Deltaproteobacteria bacterium]|nr:50S ribosomal protein L32 [Deltaproteobacteria bacterium]MBI2181246.1 50S ribosomal protein L32 [Deltaproteobacteria bacterium]MBI2230304.1 50S ribosomal protein L32 [Deltaproteobacteria bacterium]MBI2364907.1 50S ribosomal protein L32 [Deltaproteobacteria bacterium]MBI3066504.1 50S ribosomal protein L32 [Deltaproteobacteria bacterium]
MPVPKRRTSKRVKNQRRAHDALTTPQWSSCAHCGETVLPHRACSKCGYYRGRAALKIAES